MVCGRSSEQLNQDATKRDLAQPIGRERETSYFSRLFARNLLHIPI